MKMRTSGFATLIAIVAASGACNAQAVVKKEPLDMRNGATVLVDDGTCPKGMIKRLTFNHGNAMSPAPQRETKCVPR